MRRRRCRAPSPGGGAPPPGWPERRTRACSDAHRVGGENRAALEEELSRALDEEADALAQRQRLELLARERSRPAARRGDLHAIVPFAGVTDAGLDGHGGLLSGRRAYRRRPAPRPTSCATGSRRAPPARPRAPPSPACPSGCAGRRG